MQSKQQQAGLTMVELMIVVAIAAVLAGLAAPSFNGMINNTRMASAVSQLTGDLNLARSEAIKRNRRTLVCVRNTDTACGAGSSWGNGWLVCYDEDQDGACDAATAANPNPVAVRPAIHASLTLNVTANTVPAASIFFNPSGTQGAGGNAVLTFAGNWTGAVNNVATVTATGNISKTP